MKALPLYHIEVLSDEDYESDPALNNAALNQSAYQLENVQVFVTPGSKPGLIIAARNDQEPGKWTLYGIPVHANVQDCPENAIPRAHLAAIIEDAVRECTADLETKLRNRNEQIADLDKHRHDLYQERDELLHRIEALEARLEHLDGCIQDEKERSLGFRRTPDQAPAAGEQPRPPAHIWREVRPDRESPGKRDEEEA